jgi:hypothetical protein
LQLRYDTHLNRYAAGRIILKVKCNNSKFGALQTPATKESTAYGSLVTLTDSQYLPIRKIMVLGARFQRLEHHLHNLPIRFSLR